MWHIIVKKLKALPIWILKAIFPPLAAIPTKLLLLFMPEKPDGSENVGVTVFASKLKKYLIIAIVIGVICVIFWMVFSFSMFFMLDEEGLFADLNDGQDITIPDNGIGGPVVGFDDVTSVISKIDMDALRDFKDEQGNPITISGLLGSDKIATMLYKDTMSPYTYLMLYQMAGEICSEPMINPNTAENKITPGILMGVLKHENNWDFGLPHKETSGFDLRSVNPYTAWNTRLGYGTIAGWGSAPRHLATLFGTSQLFFREHTGGLDNTPKTSGTGVAIPTNVPSFSGANNVPHQLLPMEVFNIDGSGQPVLFISQVENPNYTGARVMLAVNDSATLTSTYAVGINQISPEIKQELKYQQHEYTPWSEVSVHGGIAAQRPSGAFMPDAAATTAYSFRLVANNKDTGTGYAAGSIQAAMYEGSIQNKTGVAKRYAEISGWFSIRASKPEFYASGGPGSQVIDNIVSNDLVAKFTSSAYYAKAGGSVSELLENLHITLRDPNFTEGFSPDVQTAVEAYLSKKSSTEWNKQATDGLYLLICEQAIHDTALALANAAYAKFPSANVGDGTAGYVSTVGWGGNPMDSDFDGICDDCGISIFDVGPDHTASSKLFWPTKQFHVNQLSTSGCGYHGKRPGAGFCVHDNYGWSHQAYDIATLRQGGTVTCACGTGTGSVQGGEVRAITSGLAVMRNPKDLSTFQGATSDIGEFGTSVTLYVTDKQPAAGEAITPEFILANATFTIQYAHLSQVEQQLAAAPNGLIVKAGTILGTGGGTRGLHKADMSHESKSPKFWGEHLHFEVHIGNLESTSVAADSAVNYIPTVTPGGSKVTLTQAAPKLVLAFAQQGKLRASPYVITGEG